MLHKRRWTFLLLVVVALNSCVICGRIDGHKNRKIVNDDAPDCSYNYENNMVQCYYLQAGDMALLDQVLETAASNVSSFGVHVTSSDGPAIPENVFQNYHNLSYVDFYDCNFTSMPYRLLSYIERIDGLYIAVDIFSSVEVTGPETLLPFSEFLKEFEIYWTNAETIDPSTLSQYVNLQNLMLDANSIESIGMEFLGMESLQILDLDSNNLSAIESGAFRDLKNLQYLNLFSNSFTSLQEDAFMGLENSPISYIILSDNPWNCTCELQWLKDWLNERNLTDSSGAQCTYPSKGNFTYVNFC